jgi:hypothetical protein
MFVQTFPLKTPSLIQLKKRMCRINPNRQSAIRVDILPTIVASNIIFLISRKVINYYKVLYEVCVHKEQVKTDLLNIITLAVN